MKGLPGAWFRATASSFLPAHLDQDSLQKVALEAAQGCLFGFFLNLFPMFQSKGVECYVYFLLSSFMVLSVSGISPVVLMVLCTMLHAGDYCSSAGGKRRNSSQMHARTVSLTANSYTRDFLKNFFWIPM